jgi:hypothetical protein
LLAVSQDASRSGNPDSAGGLPPLVCGEGRTTITLTQSAGIVFVTVGEEFEGRTAIEVAKRAVASGYVAVHHGVLIDVTRFVGTIDWGAVHALREMNLWDPGGAARRIAFLVRSNAFESLVTLAAALFPRAALRLFTEGEPALAWLQEPGQLPSA